MKAIAVGLLAIGTITLCLTAVTLGLMVLRVGVSLTRIVFKPSVEKGA